MESCSPGKEGRKSSWLAPPFCSHSLYRWGKISRSISGLEVFWKSMNFCAPRPMLDVVLKILLESTCGPSPAALDCSISGDRIFSRLFLDIHNVSALPRKHRKSLSRKSVWVRLCFRHSCQEQACECCCSNEKKFPSHCAFSGENK